MVVFGLDCGEGIEREEINSRGVSATATTMVVMRDRKSVSVAKYFAALR